MKKVNINDLSPEDVRLVDKAAKARENAFCPISKYYVGAAIRDTDGNIWKGCNVENAAFIAIHAEAGAIANMVQGGGTKIAAIACVTIDGGACCGDCRQKIWEMCNNNPDVPIYLFDLQGNGIITTIGELLPLPFSLNS